MSYEHELLSLRAKHYAEGIVTKTVVKESDVVKVAYTAYREGYLASLEWMAKALVKEINTNYL